MGRAAPRPCQHSDGSDGNSGRSTGKVTGSDNAEACCTRASRFRWYQFFGAWWSFLIFGWNSPDWVLNFWACVRIGAIPVLGNHFRPTEGPKVRIHLAPAASLRTIPPSAADEVKGRTRHLPARSHRRWWIGLAVGLRADLLTRLCWPRGSSRNGERHWAGGLAVTAL